MAETFQVRMSCSAKTVIMTLKCTLLLRAKIQSLSFQFLHWFRQQMLKRQSGIWDHLSHDFRTKGWLPGKKENSLNVTGSYISKRKISGQKLVLCAFAVMSLPSTKLGGCNIVTAWESTYSLLVCSWGSALWLCIFFYRCLSCIFLAVHFSPLILFWNAKSIQLNQVFLFFHNLSSAFVLVFTFILSPGFLI